MTRRKSLLFLLVIMTAIPLAVSGLALHVSYQAALAQQEARLMESAERQAHLFDTIVEATKNPAVAEGIYATAFERFHEQAKSRELIFGRREGDRIVFFFAPGGGALSQSVSVPFSGRLGEPMRRALLGQTGTMIGLDRRGVQVVAAYHPVASLGWGVVIKIDLAELRAPYVKAAELALGITLLLVILGGLFFIRTTSRLARSLEESEQKFRGIVETAREGICLLDEEVKLRFVNPRMTRLLGYAAEEMLGRSFFDFVSEEDRAAAAHAWTKRGEKATTQLDLRLHPKDGGEFWALFSVAPATGERGSAPQWLGMFTDITERKREEQARAQLAAMVESSGDAIIGKSLDGRIVSWNPGAEALYGYTADEVIGHPLSVLVPPDRQDELAKILETIGRGERIGPYETARLRKDGTHVDVSFTISPVRNPEGKVIGASTIARDITAHKQLEAQLEAAHFYTRSLIEASIDPMMTTDPAGLITDVNRQVEALTGKRRQELIGSPFKQYFTDPARAQAGVELVLRQGKVTDYELTTRSVTGQETVVSYNATTYYDREGRLRGVFAAARDITDRKRAEGEIKRMNEELERRVQERTAELTASNKELEAFTYAVAHDLRSPLRHMQGFSNLLREECGTQLNPGAQHYLDRICEGTDRMGHLVEDLLNLSRVGQQELCLQVCGLNSLVDDALADLRAEAKDREIEWRIGSLPFTECDPALMKQVLANLLANAIKFTRPRSRAVIEVGQTTANGEPVVFVRDNGVGFSMKYAERLFGVFQRLHRQEDFEGTGVGLATAQRIIQKHGGRVWAEAELDQGATFYFSLGAQHAKGVSEVSSVNVGGA